MNFIYPSTVHGPPPTKCTVYCCSILHSAFYISRFDVKSQNLLTRIGNSLFHSSLFRSKSLILLSDCEQFALVALNKRPTVSDSLRSLMIKEGPSVNGSVKERHEWFTLDSSESLSKMSDFFQKIHNFRMFLTVFHCFSTYLYPRANRSCSSLLSCSFLKSNESDSLSSLLTKMRPWAIRSFPWANRSLAHKKRLIRSKNRWAYCLNFFVEGWPEAASFVRTLTVNESKVPK